MNYDRELLLESVGSLGLPEWVVDVLMKDGLEDVEGVCSCTRTDLIKLVGRDGMILVDAALRRLGLKLGCPLYFLREGRKS